MRRADPPTRAASIAATATTLVALLAMAAGAHPATYAAGGLPIDRQTIAPLRDTTAVRVMAAAMAAARDLLTSTSPQAVAPSQTRQPAPVARIAIAIVPTGTRVVAADRLPARLLDLPPPVC